VRPDSAIFVASCAHDEFVSGPGFSNISEKLSILLERCLVSGVKNFVMSYGCFMGCRKGCSDTNKKTNYITCLETARRIY
jgi:hypothetical protein